MSRLKMLRNIWPLVFVVVSMGCGASPVTVKPQSPLTITISPEGELTVEQPIAFMVTVTSTIASSRLRIMVHPPGDMQLVDGALLWEGGIAAGEMVTVRFVGQFSSAHPNTVNATAIFETPSGGRMAAHGRYQFGESPSRKPEAGGMIRKRDGVEIYEVPLERQK